MTATEVLQRFGELPLTLELEIGTLQMPIRDVLELGEGSVLRTDHPADTPFPLRAGDITLAEAEVVMVDDSVSVRISKMLPGAKPTSGEHGTD